MLSIISGITSKLPGRVPNSWFGSSLGSHVQAISSLIDVGTVDVGERRVLRRSLVRADVGPLDQAGVLGPERDRGDADGGPPPRQPARLP